MLHVRGMLVLLLGLAGCGAHGGGEFLGKWVSIQSDRLTMEIVRNGDAFLVRRTAPSLISGKAETVNVPATFKDGTLQIHRGFGTITLAVDQASDHLTDGEREYRRLR